MLVLASACGGAGGGGFGEEGDPVDIKVGYQPYYTESWSGVVMREQELWKKHLPEGSNVTFEIGLQGSVIVNRMVAGKEQIGYMGDMPAIVATTKRQTKDLRIVSTLGTSKQQCNVFMVDKGAPEFDNPKDAVQWMDGKTVATPKGSCTDRFTQAAFQQQGIQPESYLNQSIEVITTNFQNDKIDAAAIWEPTAASLAEQGIARRAASGVNYDITDAGFMVMSKDLIDQRPDVVKGFLKAELEAQKFLANPENSNKLAQMAVNQTEGFSKKAMWQSMYKDWPESKGGSPDNLRLNQPYIVTEDVQSQIENATQFLFEIETINTENLPEGAIDDSTAREVLNESGGSAPVGEVKALPESEFSK
jgi:NitT/TauT family transport system substrate-binding protein